MSGGSAGNDVPAGQLTAGTSNLRAAEPGICACSADAKACTKVGTNWFFNEDRLITSIIGAG